MTMDPLRVACGECGVDVLSEDQVCFYNLYQNGVHFCVRPELLTSLIEIPPGQETAYIYEQDKRHNDKPPVEMMQVDGRTLRVVPHPNVQRRKISPHGVVCTACSALLGSLCMNGPCHEAILGFSTNAVHIIKVSSGERVGPGKWATIATFLPQIQRRDPITFYTEPDNEVIGAFRSPPLPVNLPTMEMFARRDPKTFLKDLTLDKPRPYQIECFIQAAMTNTIVYLPTGAGKTMVAAMMTAMMYKLNPMKQVVMVVHRVSLGFQQAQYLKDQTGLDVLIACGETSEDVPKKRLAEFNVLVCTAQILINWIKRSVYRLEDASLLVLDEVHNAVKSHPYVLIMKEFYEKVDPRFRPRFLGLSASPAVGSKNHQMVFSINQLQETCASRIYMPAIYWDDLACTVNRPEIRFTTVQVSEECKRMEAIILGYCNSLLPKLGRALKIEAALILPSHEMARGFIRVLNERAHNEGNEEACQLAIHLHQVYSAIELNSIIGPNSARQYLGDLLADALRQQKASDSWLEEEGREALRAVIEAVKAFTGSSCKVEALVAILKGIPDGEAEKSRLLVFVQTKRTARWLCDILRGDEVLGRRWLPAVFVGQSGGQVDGMSYLEEQAPVLLKFRQGQHRLLISTNVLQEGMDVPVCNRVVLFDQTWSLTSFIQSRGRARATQSVYDLVCSEEDRTKYEELIRTEAVMQTNIVRTMEYEGCLSLPVTMLTLKMKLETEGLAGWKSGTEPSGTIGGDAAAAGKGGRSRLADGRPRKIRAVSLTLFNLPADITEEQLAEGILAGIPLKDHKLTRLLDELGSLADVGAAWELTAESSASHPLRLNDLHRLLVDVIKALTGHLTRPPLLSFRLVGVPPPACHEMFLAVSEGLAVGNLLEPTQFYRARSIGGQVKLGVSLPQAMLRAFYMDPEDQRRVFRLDIDLASVDRFLLVDPLEPGRVTLVVPVTRSPLLYYAHADGRIRDVRLTNMDRLAWERAGIDEFNRDFLDLADCAAFRFELEAKGREKDELMAVVQRLKPAAGIEPLFCALPMVDGDGGARMMGGAEIDRAIEAEYSGDFELSYALRVLFSSSFGATSFRVGADFFRVLRMIPASERIARLERLALRIQGQRFPDLALLLLECHHQQPDEDAAVLKRSRPPNTAPVRFVTLTPTKLVFQTPKDMIRNRITRSFNPEYFLRVHFRDEDLLRLSSVRSEASLKNLLARVEGLLASGIAVGGRQFDFLAMSSSQLRDHGCWFVAPHEGGPGEGLWDADRIRAWCGDLSSIKNVAKFVARLGQSLSASQDTVHSSPEDWQLLPDVCVTSEKADGQPKEYTFTDGIGMISPALAREVAQALGMSPVPSAFQIRFAGFKGVVAANPNVCPEDPLRRLWLRPSMKKFDSPHRVLEVLNTTQYIACHLNRQVVMILSGLGVPDEAFLRLQDAMLARMGRMLLEGGTGSRFLAQNCHCLPPLPFGHQPAFDAALTMEPFFRSLILAAYQRQMAELLTRSRVFLPRARILMGTIDETGSLEPDQVFVQCSRVPTDDECASNAFIWDEERNLFTVLGAVTIAKNPCMHPGDVRRLSAVDHPALRRTHFDCVVFPAKGPRPLTDMCSGSDLDGDLYFVAWDPALLPPATYPPMEYDAPKATVVEGPIGLPHIRRFLVDFIANDQLGMLANAHVAHVDHKPLGVCDPICMRLAYLFSMSVDFPKTGFIPDFPKEAKVALWPDFMQKTDLPGYPSQKVIGRMFRKVRAIAGATPKHINLAWLVRPNPRLVIDGHQKYLEEARMLYGQYAEAMGLILGVYGIHSEAQVFAGSLSEVGSLAKDDLKAAIDVVKTKVSGLQRTFRQRFEAPFEAGLADPAEKTAKASAWYVAAYSAPRKALGMSAPVLSFPWVVGPLLVEILANGEAAPSGQVQMDYEMARSIPYVLGCDVLREARGMAGETDLLPAFMERLHFATLLIRNIQARLKEGGVAAELGLAGSSSTGLFGGASDINLLFFQGSSTREVFLQSLVPVVMEMFPGCSLSAAKDELHHRAPHQQSFSFSIRVTDADQRLGPAPHLIVRRACEAEPWLFGLLLVLQRWARAQGFVRRSTWHSGALSSCQLSLVMIMILASKGIISVPSDMADEDSLLLLSSEGEYSRMESILSAIARTNDASTSARIGNALMALIDFLAFSPEAEVTALLKQSQADGDEGQVSAIALLLKEHAFKAFHILAQTLSCQALWSALAVSAEVQQELALCGTATRRSAKLLRRKGGSGGGAAFMEGASLLLFQGANSDVDRVAFELYQLKRRPQHLHTQCYTPVLVSPSSISIGADSKAFNDYFAQAIRQFGLLKRLGTPAYGSVKMAIKFGQLYLTSLPRMFLEEGASANVANVRRALAMGYEAVGQNRQRQFDPAAGLVLEPMREVGGDDDKAAKAMNGDAEDKKASAAPSAPPVPAGDDAILQKGNEEGDLKSMKAVVRRKAHLTPLSSSFEPFVFSEAGIRPFLRAFSFVPKEAPLSSYAVSLTLFNAVTSLNTDYQLIYDAGLGFVKMSTRPLRWMVVDVKGGQAETASCPNAQDLRFLLSSRHDIDLSTRQAVGNGMLEQLQKGVLEFIPEADVASSPIAGRGNHLRVLPAFRSNDRIFVRASHHESFGPGPSTVAMLQAHFPAALAGIPRALLSRLCIRISWIAEYCDPSAETGKFASAPAEKTEVEVDLALDWELIQRDCLEGEIGVGPKELVAALWTVGHLIQQQLNTTGAGANRNENDD